MNDIEARREKLKSEYKRKLLELDREETLCEGLPAGVPMPKHCTFPLRLAEKAWLTWEVKSLEEARDIVSKLNPLGIMCHMNGTTSITPNVGGAEALEAVWTLERAVFVEQSGGRGYGPDFSLCAFYAHSDDMLVRATVKVTGLSRPNPLTARMTDIRWACGEAVKAELVESDALRKGAAHRIKWYAGAVDSFRLSYFFSLEDFMGLAAESR